MDEEALQAVISTYQQMLANTQRIGITAEVQLDQTQRKLRAAEARIQELEQAAAEPTLPEAAEPAPDAAE